MVEAKRVNDAWWVVRPDTAVPGDELSLPLPFYNRYTDPTRYDPDPGLAAAVNVALLLGQPLLLTGAPGSGKTSVAYWLAHQLGLPEPLVQFVKSTTGGRDLLYQFDELSRFRDAQGGPVAARPLQEYLEFNALGQAILFSAGPNAQAAAYPGAPQRGLGQLSHKILHRGSFPAARRQVVLIDELDKAPTDTPNDLLNEFEQMKFRIPELGLEICGDPERRPIVVVTSNSDKPLPEPFLRRCVYHHIELPDTVRQAAIFKRRMPDLRADNPALFEDATAMLDGLRTSLGRDIRQPGTAEMLAWLDVIGFVYPRTAEQLLGHPDYLNASIGTLVKTQEDQERVRRHLGLR